MAVDMTEPIVGAPIKRVEDPRFITGKGRYLDDIQMTGTTHLAVLDGLHICGNGDRILHGATAHRGRSILDGRHDVLIAGTATEVPLQLLTNLLVGGVWVAL